jgi:hypothetical protein
VLRGLKEHKVRMVLLDHRAHWQRSFVRLELEKKQLEILKTT